MHDLNAHIEAFGYLDDLRDSGETNMFGAGRYVEDEFDYDRKTASYFVTSWMKSFESGETDYMARAKIAFEAQEDT